ncbi:hypothetical protein BCGT_3059 [Mycobacterium tuberculosis variant bovis BCG str. ATCC 35743]|nr:hypothetical protein BCGT_3059 [Mycobacterium tuberculosis variant bovis BCG str. ATCC 35743]KAF3397689.1 hypothetical protein BIT18_2909 [Mycobacterium tuberculosis variant bovis]KAF3408126.1 hypothetical protein BIT17_1654 [Mycobacterium tuberculosis variant bovis]KAF3418229.1 hypothetical protein BIS44_3949 [Mycobacterium tuberculosis variant bovis BCG]
MRPTPQRLSALVGACRRLSTRGKLNRPHPGSCYQINTPTG